MQIRIGPASSVGVRDRRPGARSGEEPPVRSSVKPSHAANDNLIDRTRQVWHPRLGRDLSREPARQIAENATASSPSSPNGRAPRCPFRRTARRSLPPRMPARCAMKAETIATALGGRKAASAGWRAALRRRPAHGFRAVAIASSPRSPSGCTCNTSAVARCGACPAAPLCRQMWPRSSSRKPASSPSGTR